MTVGDRIKRKREELRISQTELANKCKISKQTLYKYENNIVTNIPSDKLELIATALKVSPAHLMGWEEPDIIYKDENAEFLIEVTKKSKDKDFVDRMTKYMSLMNENKKSVDDMIDFMYNKEQKRDDN